MWELQFKDAMETLSSEGRRKHVGPPGCVRAGGRQDLTIPSITSMQLEWEAKSQEGALGYRLPAGGRRIPSQGEAAAPRLDSDPDSAGVPLHSSAQQAASTGAAPGTAVLG